MGKKALRRLKQNEFKCKIRRCLGHARRMSRAGKQHPALAERFLARRRLDEAFPCLDAKEQMRIGDRREFRATAESNGRDRQAIPFFLALTREADELFHGFLPFQIDISGKSGYNKDNIT